MSGRLDGKAALISGGASGIGAETGRRMAAEGARVALCDVQSGLGQAVAEKIGEAACFIDLDVTREEDWQRGVAEAEERFGGLQIVMNCAGISVPGAIDMATFEQWRHTMSVNADSVFLGCKYGVEALRRSGGGAIINVSSTWALRAGSMFPAYGASKAAVAMLTKSVALRCAEAGWNIRCNSIHPGATLTPMVTPFIENAPDPDAARAALGSAHPMNRLGKPEEIAMLAVFLASDESPYMTGTEIPVDGGFCA
jgi:3(or 17)beta-hydroxysteroid dehydrogenase